MLTSVSMYFCVSCVCLEHDILEAMGSVTEWEKEKEKDKLAHAAAIFKPLGTALASRFTRSQDTTEAPKVKLRVNSTLVFPVACVVVLCYVWAIKLLQSPKLHVTTCNFGLCSNLLCNYFAFQGTDRPSRRITWVR